jgi:hypothetical protein
LSNKSFFEDTEYNNWKKEVEETGEYDQWVLEQLEKEVKTNFGENNG